MKRAHDIDANLSAHVMHENLVSKASSVLALLNVIHVTGIDRNQVEYVIDCAEEACGDINQRGGGNFAKSAAEIAGLNNASGSDCRAFCAAPRPRHDRGGGSGPAALHTVVVTAGGCTAKLGMNGKDHVKKGLPAFEDMIGGFAVVITQDDGVNPFINLNMLGRHSVGTGSAPAGRHHLSGHRSAGSQRPEDHRYRQVFPGDAEPRHHQPAGAGDVPLANYKMIGALAVKRVSCSGLSWPTSLWSTVSPASLPTQGHIPSGVPYVGFAREALLAGDIKRVMVIGKGSLFLGRLTNLFDGVSFVIEANPGKEEAAPRRGRYPDPSHDRRRHAWLCRDAGGADGGVSMKNVNQTIAETFREVAEYRETGRLAAVPACR